MPKTTMTALHLTQVQASQDPTPTLNPNPIENLISQTSLKTKLKMNNPTGERNHLQTKPNHPNNLLSTPQERTLHSINHPLKNSTPSSQPVKMMKRQKTKLETSTEMEDSQVEEAGEEGVEEVALTMEVALTEATVEALTEATVEALTEATVEEEAVAEAEVEVNADSTTEAEEVAEEVTEEVVEVEAAALAEEITSVEETILEVETILATETTIKDSEEETLGTGKASKTTDHSKILMTCQDRNILT